MNDNPAFESRRVRTHPRTVTGVPVGTFPLSTDATSTWSPAAGISLFRLSVEYPWIERMKIGMISLGCPKNLVDSEVMLGLAQQAGHQLTRDAADADVLIVNTCAFIDKAKQESIDTILEMAELKKSGRCQRLVVTGCMGERYRDELREQIPEIDAVLGTGDVPDIVAALGGEPAQAGPHDGLIPLLRANGEAITLVAGGLQASGLPTYIYDAETPRLLATPRHYAYV